MLLVTHSGSFHADDVLAVALATLIHPEAQVLRSRHPGVIAAADWRLDVGGAFDPDAGTFDHHFPGAPVRWNAVRFSTASLLWSVEGVPLLRRLAPHIDGERATRTAAFLDEALFWGIDRVDNGQADTTDLDRVLPEALGRGNLTWQERPDSLPAVEALATQHFLDTVGRVRPILERLLGRAARAVSLQECRQLTDKAIQEIVESMRDRRQAEAQAVAAARPVLVAVLEDQRFGHGILRLDNPSLPWATLIHELEREVALQEPITHVLKQETSGLWIASAVPVAPRSFVSRVPFPASWAGARDAELAARSQIAGAAFCHVNRFISGWHTEAAAVQAIQAARAAAALLV